MDTFKDYVRKYDPGKTTWVELWETGQKTVRPASVTFEGTARSSPTAEGKLDADGFRTTGANCNSVEPVVVRLPHPYENGIDYYLFTSDAADECIKHVISVTPWLGRVGGKKSAQKAAKQNPGVMQLYDAGNGYWRSSIYALVSDFATCRRTGIDPRAEVAGAATNRKSQKEPRTQNSSVHTATKRENEQTADQAVHKHQYAEGHADERALVAGIPVAASTPVGVPVEKKQKSVVAVDPDRLKPPAAHHQIFRYAGECDALEKYLKKKGLFRYATTAHWRAIREWLKGQDGRKYLKEMCGLDPDSVQLDHIRPKDSGQLDHMYNCYFMPASLNAHFGDRWDNEKKIYIGDRARTKSRRFMQWYAKQAAALIDVGLYSGNW